MLAISNVIGVGKTLWAVLPAVWKAVASSRERHELRRTLFREIANNYECLLYETKQAETFEAMADMLRNRLEFIAFDQAQRDAIRFYKIQEHGWIQAVYRSLKECTALQSALDEAAFIEKLEKAAATIADTPTESAQKLLTSMLPTNYAKNIS